MFQKKGTAASATLWGVEAEPIHVEVEVVTGATQFEILGHYHPPAVRESRERIRAALRSCGVDLTSLSVLVNLAPTDLPKELPSLDLPIALALLAALGHLPQSALDGRLVCGELGLDGSIRAIRGGLAFAEHAVYIGSRELLLPAATAADTSPLRAIVGEFPLAPLTTLAQAVQHLIVGEPFSWPPAALPQASDPIPELSEICGLEVPKRALEIAATGAHNLLFQGPRGTSPLRLARRLPGLLPQLTPLEAIEVTMIASLFSDSAVPDLLRQRPFRSPHATASHQSMVGGTRSIPRPGEATFAHQGVLYLEDLPEFRRETLMALRTPLREGTVNVCLPHLSRRVHMPPASFWWPRRPPAPAAIWEILGACATAPRACWIATACASMTTSCSTASIFTARCCPQARRTWNAIEKLPPRSPAASRRPVPSRRRATARPTP
jgi:magnesium chelatase family protein